MIETTQTHGRFISSTSIKRYIPSGSAVVCTSCNKTGHTAFQCKQPIVSYGLIMYRINDDSLEYLMINRKHTFGYTDYVRGNYTIDDVQHIQEMVDEMTLREKNLILRVFDLAVEELSGKITEDKYNVLWQDLWENPIYLPAPILRRKCEQSMAIVRECIKQSTTKWTNTELEFPKGRKNHLEKDIECAVREFCEETGIKAHAFAVCDNVIPLDEEYVGSNNKCYKHKYFLATPIDDETDIDLTHYQTSEIGGVEWKSYDECMTQIRNYNTEKIGIVKKIHGLLNKHLVQGII